MSCERIKNDIEYWNKLQNGREELSINRISHTLADDSTLDENISPRFVIGRIRPRTGPNATRREARPSSAERWRRRTTSSRLETRQRDGSAARITCVLLSLARASRYVVVPRSSYIVSIPSIPGIFVNTKIHRLSPSLVCILRSAFVPQSGAFSKTRVNDAVAPLEIRSSAFLKIRALFPSDSRVIKWESRRPRGNIRCRKYHVARRRSVEARKCKVYTKDSTTRHRIWCIDVYRRGMWATRAIRARRIIRARGVGWTERAASFERVHALINRSACRENSETRRKRPPSAGGQHLDEARYGFLLNGEWL